MDKKKIRALAAKVGKGELANLLGVSPRTLQGWLNGRSPSGAAIAMLRFVSSQSS